MTTTTILTWLVGMCCGAAAVFAWMSRQLRAEVTRANNHRGESEAALRELSAARATSSVLAEQARALARTHEQLEASLAGERERGAAQLAALRNESAEAIAACQLAKSAADAQVAALQSTLRAHERSIEEGKAALELARRERDVVQRNCDASRNDLGRAQEALAAQEQRVEHLQQRASELPAAQSRIEELHLTLTEKVERVATLTTELEAERRASEDKLKALHQSHTQLEDRFKGIAAQILESNSQKFESTTQLRLNEMSENLGKHVKALQDKVEHTHSLDLKDRTALHTELQAMVAATKRVDQDAVNLTRALTGDRKTQGAWGELVLSRILEQCGLREGVEYEKQVTFKDEDDKRRRPDVLVRLPGARSIVIDAKVSLTAYNEYACATSDEQAEAAITRHLTSVRSHIKNLSSKDYWALNGLEGSDYVLMFLPIESAFADALRNDPTLFEDAFREHIILTAPSTLLATLRTIDHTWRVERQNETARTIVEEAGKLYDRFVGFTEDLAKVGSRLRQAQSAFDDAEGKLCEGRGNLVRRADNLRKLGVKVKKALPSELAERSQSGLLALEADADEALSVDEADNECDSPEAAPERVDAAE